jgi:hypothetical protein
MEIVSKNELLSMVERGMTCFIIGKKFNVSHVKINWLLRKYEINIKEIQSKLPRYYVYAHKYKGEVFYIGSGQGGHRRLWDFNKRSKEWLEYVESINYNFDAEILEVCNDKHEAAKKEKFYGYYYTDKGYAKLWKEDFRGSKNGYYKHGKYSNEVRK